MCTNLRYIYSRSRLLSPFHQERLLVPVKCGVCSECQSSIRNDWYYRIYYEWLSTMCSGGYVFFDTLTYSDDFLPHLSEFVDKPLPKSIDFPCFCYEDIRYFFVRLRRSLSYAGYNIEKNLRYFLTSEYGTSEEYTDSRGIHRVATHRPHYHVLFFILPESNLDVATLRDFVDDAWFFGRTDKVRYFGEHSNYFVKGNHDDINSRCVSSYVAKYVQKDCKFQDEINSRLTRSIEYLYLSNFVVNYAKDKSINIDSDPNIELPFIPSYRALKLGTYSSYSLFDSFFKSEFGKKCVRDLSRLVNQFHRQSIGFGDFALSCIDIDHLMNSGLVTLPDSKRVIKQFSLPIYYERKLFYEVKKFNPLDLSLLPDDFTNKRYNTKNIPIARCWQLSSFGKLWKRSKNERTFKKLVAKYTALNRMMNYHPDVSPTDLARYCVYKRYRFKANLSDDVTFSEKLNLPNLWFNYSCPSDRSIFHESLVSKSYVGCSSIYLSDHLDYSIPIKDFLRDHMFVIPEYESILHLYDVFLSSSAIARDNLFNYLQQYNLFEERAWCIV